MTTVLVIAGGVFFSICIISFVLWYNKRVEKKEFIESELKDILMKCQGIEEKCKEGYAVFFPHDDEKYLYDILVERGEMIKNPMGKGYSFLAAAEELWKGVPTDGFARAIGYEDDDGVIQVFKDKEGNIVEVTEDQLKEKKDGDSRNLH